MEPSEAKDFLRRDWQATKRNLFAKPSFIAVASLLVVGTILVGRSYMANRRFQAKLDAMERAAQVANQKADAAQQDTIRFAEDTLQKHGLSNAQVQATTMKAATNSLPGK